ncbi:MAG: HD domain-containing protein [Oscillospiraceae bacterium]|nr:HD domain-containing protein [Oscillospiraceae bacterium]
MENYEKLKDEVWETLKDYPMHMASVWSHFYGVASLCAFLGLKRGLDMEICKCAGLLHDLWLFLNVPMDIDTHKKHGYLGSDFSREILNKNGGYSEEQTEIICRMIYNHNDKDIFHDEYSETLKDADVLEHYLNNSGDENYKYYGRDKKIFDEFMIFGDYFEKHKAISGNI